MKNDLKPPIKSPIPTSASKTITMRGYFFKLLHSYSKSSRLSGSTTSIGAPSFSTRKSSLKDAMATST